MITTNNKKSSAKVVDHNDAMIAELKENPSYAEIYLQTAFEEIYEPGGIPAFLTALRRVIEARGGLGEFSKQSGISRQHLYTSLSENGNPTLSRLVEITRAVGVRLFHTSQTK
ncbi:MULTISPECIES: DNA-binding protein [Yersinia]|jgi:probable addiction module antidote protein|uniref:helix-turn-helix domain-containing transcriptional regulator n=1 Tax=Yersinia TaxID=629 RepID=UPI0005E78646|nr:MULTISPECIES: DNA-binding protein [Yersinia]EKN3638051.1 DNA-binding protein [Yersinia enterocolitica]EKN6003802.1 DNA-binding protein [Yersinia enterocolitica]RXA93774.1 DNA-binding protein [Yersinia sp. 2105 StPb PI]CFB71324.1 putative DNA-binding prophage protein [Yersinia enterocolitica]CNH94673.1 putative DNA-binding prophage protein [Yersinia intermedia]